MTALKKKAPAAPAAKKPVAGKRPVATRKSAPVKRSIADKEGAVKKSAPLKAQPGGKGPLSEVFQSSSYKI